MSKKKRRNESKNSENENPNVTISSDFSTKNQQQYSFTYNQNPEDDSQKESLSEFYMKQFKRRAVIGKILIWFALFSFIAGIIILPIFHSAFLGFINKDIIFRFMLISILLTFVSAIVHYYVQKSVLYHIKLYCYTAYPYDEIARIQEIRELALQYMGMSSSLYIHTLLTRR